MQDHAETMLGAQLQLSTEYSRENLLPRLP